jgi:hypothetical protein
MTANAAEPLRSAPGTPQKLNVSTLELSAAPRCEWFFAFGYHRQRIIRRIHAARDGILRSRGRFADAGNRRVPRTIRHVAALYGHVPARDFGPLVLKTVRQRFIEPGWCRSIVNRRVNRVRHIFKWGIGKN